MNNLMLQLDLEHFLKIIKTYPKVDKVGFSLKIDDLPNAYPNKKLVVQWESRYTKKISQTPLLFDAQIDTTFALYRPNRITPFNRIGRGIRTGFPYTARHLPWYSVKETEEDQYYKSHQNGGASWFQPDDYVKIIQDAQKQRKHIIANKIYCLLVSKKILLPLKILLSFLPQKTKKRIVRILIGNPH